MIWQSQAHIIVMLTKVFDFIRVMCAQYWPSTINSSEVYGPYEVTLIDEDKLADYVIRTIKVTFNTRVSNVSQLFSISFRFNQLYWT
jgi:protein tyrosine phosphatase